MGDKCYLVTFKKVDPLFVIDLTDPTAPQILGKLKVPGYSDYLHPYDATHLIGLGKETEEAKEGDFTWYQGVKISLFDVTDVSRPSELDKLEIGDRGTDSPVLSDHKALLFSRDRHLLVLPILLAEIDEAQYPQGVPTSAYGNFVWQGAYVLDVSLDHGITVKGTITHMGDNQDLLRSGYYFESAYAVKRAVYVEDVLYTLSDSLIQLHDLATLEELNEVTLA
jgi:inhibitor of cysteine peptidase